MVRPDAFDRRIPAWRTHRDLGARFEELNEIASVASYGDEAGEAAAIAKLAIADLCALPRCGLKNAGAPDWLAARGVVIPEIANRAARQDDGGLCIRMGDADIMVTADPAGRSNRPQRLLAEWTSDSTQQKGWNAHREEGFGWFLLTGRLAPEFWSRTCAVDMRLDRFADLSIAQTRAFGMSGIIARADLGAVPAFHLFFDIASSDYLIKTVRDIMGEFEGRMVGLIALRQI